MMVLIDTTVWIDFFRGNDTPQVDVLEKLIAEEADICTCGIIMMEVLQGIRSDTDYKTTRSHFNTLIYLPADRNTFISGARIYRTLRQKGITIRKPVDCLIASIALENDVPLLHNDRDFDQITEYVGLKTL
jgi:predicted nucleic acid-binding protein